MSERILVAIDGSATAECALRVAIKQAGGKGHVRLVYAVEDGYPVDEEACALIDFDAMEQAANETGERMLLYAAEQVRESGAEVETALIVGGDERPAREIDREARKWKADLIVIGAHGGSGISRLRLGSVADEVLRGASVPVLLVHRDCVVL